MTTPAPSPSATPLDLTLPGAATTMLRRLIAAAGSNQLLQVEVTATDAAITVLRDGKPVTWAWRDLQLQQVDSDVLNVDQDSFTLDQFQLDDLGHLFSVAALIADSAEGQELQIVDSSSGEVMMSVSTLPESRTVFFYPDGRLLPKLDYDSESGVASGLKDAIGARDQALAIGVKSDVGAYLDYAGTGEKVTVRRLRPASVPITIIERSERTDNASFSPTLVSSASIWRVVKRARDAGTLAAGQPWSVVVEARDGAALPSMYFRFGISQQVTDLAGHALKS